MKKTLDFLIPNTRENIESLIRQYFWKNGYYELKSQSGLKFAKESGSDIVLSPRRLDHQWEIYLSDMEKEVVVHAVFEASAAAYHPTVVDREFVDGLLEHFQSCVTTGEIGVFNIEKYEKLIEPYSKKYMLAFSTLLILCVIALPVFDLQFLVLPVLLIAPAGAVLLINRQIAKKRQAHS